MQKILYNAKIVSSRKILRQTAILIANEKIIYLGNRKDCKDYISREKQVEEIDCKGNYLSSGFIELHSHGGGGYDFMDGDVDCIIKASQLHLLHGTTSIYPTSMTCDNETLFKFFQNYRKALNSEEITPHFLGIHLEGPFLAPNQSGAQSALNMQIPTSKNIQNIWERGKDIIKRWSIAPELEGAFSTGDFLKEKDVQLSIAHSDATYEVVKQSIKHGFSHVTHLYSGMSSITRKKGNRILGVVESSFLFDELTVELIADGKHLPPELLKLIIKCKDNSKICLVSDSMRGAGQKEGPSILGSKENGLPVIIEDGIAKTLDRESFAGSIATSDILVRTMVKDVGLSIAEAIALITENPARFMNIDDKKGSIEIGKDADIVIFDENINIKKVYLLAKDTDIRRNI